MSAKLLAELIGDLNVEVTGDRQTRVNGLAFDSRKVELGYLFVAIDGLSVSGRSYVADAIDRGASVIAGAGQPDRSRPGIVWVKTDNPRRFLAQIANRYYGFPGRGMRLIGVTGTNGKTTTTYLIRSILEAAGEQSGLIGTIRHFDGENWLKADNTTPESLDIIRMLNKLHGLGIKNCVAEVSSHAIALERVAELDFQIGVFTNLTQDHLDFHQTLDEYRDVKLRFFRELKPDAWAVYNADDPVGPQVKAATRARTFSYGFKPGSAVHAEILMMTEKVTNLRLTVDETELAVTTSLIGRHNVFNIMAAAAAARCAGLQDASIPQGIQRLRNVPGRMERVENKAGLTVFVDYAHSPDALANLIKTIRSIRGSVVERDPLAETLASERPQGRIIVVFGCGGNRDKGKRPQMGKIASDLADRVIITSDNPRDEDPLAIIEEIKKGVTKDNCEVVPNRYNAIERALNVARPQDVVLVAGKGHEDYQIIGAQRHHFDDRETVRAILDRKA